MSPPSLASLLLSWDQRAPLSTLSQIFSQLELFFPLEDPFSRSVTHFVDALVRASLPDSYIAGGYLFQKLEEQPLWMLDYAPFLSWLEQELTHMRACLKGEVPLPTSPEWERIQQAHPGWVASSGLTPPWLILPPLASPLTSSADPSLFCFASAEDLWLQLRHSSFVEAFCAPSSYPFILDRFSLPQFEANGALSPELPLVLLGTEEKGLRPLIQQAQTCENTRYQLYDLGKRLHYRRLANRYGPSRSLALWYQYAILQWQDPYKQPPSPPLSPHLTVPHLLKPHLQPTQKRPPSSGKLRLAHITRMVTDRYSAVSETLRTLIEHHDPECFELFLYTTESGMCLPKEYPYQSKTSGDSRQWGSLTLEWMAQKGVTIHIDGDWEKNYAQKGADLCQALKKDGIDIAIFHMGYPPELIAAANSDVPCSVYMDHGGYMPPPELQDLTLPYWGLPSEKIYDLILACEKQRLTHEEIYKKMGTEMVHLPIVTDPKQSWSRETLCKSTLISDPQAQLLTTVSLSLKARLTEEFCRVIAAILHQNPHAHYFPIGPLDDPTPLCSRFEQLGCADRVHFLGRQPHPEKYLKVMDLYLNEFPFGGGFSVIEAMASGVPVVTMFDPTGPSQARRGAHYLGEDLCVDKGDEKGFIQLASSLLQNPSLHQKWSQEMRHRYQKQIDVKQYVKSLEETLVRFIQSMGSQE